VRKNLTILAPGDSLPVDGHAVLLVDDQVYAKSLFERVAESIQMGNHVVEVSGGYQLDTKAREAVNVIDQVDAHVVCFASDDTHVNTFLRIVPHCRDYTIVVHGTLNLGAHAALERNGVPYVVHSRSMSAFEEADIALMCNDVGKEERLFIHRCRRRGIPTISLQESINIDFDGQAMRWADRTFLDGTHAMRYHPRILTVLTGIPRYDDIRQKPSPENPYVLINCNFTYGVASSWGRTWLDQTIQAAKDAGMEYRITVHPRDETDLSDVENVMDSSAFVVHDQIAGAYVLISRDSSLPYEALLMNRHVIYYNPFHEPEKCLNDDDTGLIQQCDDPDELASLLKTLSERPQPLDSDSELTEMFQHYYTGTEGRSHLRVVRALQVFLDHDYLGRPDHQADSYLVAWTRVLMQNVLRPKLREVRWVRAIWQFFKYTIFGYERS
jgi:hypothetical protein